MTRKKSDPALSTIGERGFLKSLLPRISRFKSHRFLVPPGDDAAIMKGAGAAVLSIDGLTEGTHFKSSWDKICLREGGFSLARGLGWKLLGSSLSDLAAMGRTNNRWAMTYLGAPGWVRKKFLEELYRGSKEAAEKYDCALAGGDTVRAKDISLVSAVGGTLQGRALKRSGARPGDWICVAGAVGDAGVGLKLLQKKLNLKSKADRAYFIRRFFQAAPQFAAGAALSTTRGVTALIDLSDSLGETVKLICEASQVGACLDVSLVPVSAPYLKSFKRTQSLLTGGEDYALFFTARTSALKQLRKKCDFSVIGRVLKKFEGIRFLSGGQRLPSPAYFRHF